MLAPHTVRWEARTCLPCLDKGAHLAADSPPGSHSEPPTRFPQVANGHRGRSRGQRAAPPTRGALAEAHGHPAGTAGQHPAPDLQASCQPPPQGGYAAHPPEGVPPVSHVVSHAVTPLPARHLRTSHSISTDRAPPVHVTSSDPTPREGPVDGTRSDPICVSATRGRHTHRPHSERNTQRSNSAGATYRRHTQRPHCACATYRRHTQQPNPRETC